MAWRTGIICNCLLAATAAGQTGATLVTTIVERETHSPLGYSTVTVAAVGRPDSISRFTDDAGQILFGPLVPGRYRIRARELGFAPADTVVELRDTASHAGVVLALRAIPHRLATVDVRSQAVCRQPGEDSSGLSGIAALIRENAHRAQLLTAAYPFYYQREERFTESKRLIRVDTGTYDSRRHPGYRAGHLLRTQMDRQGNRSTVFALPNLQDLADSAFERLHCFWFAGSDSGAIRVDVAPVVTLGAPDVAAEFYLDPTHYVVRRAIFHLTHPDRLGPLLKAWTVETRYRELAPLVAVADSIVSTMEIAERFRSTTRTIVEEDRLIAVWDATGLASDTASQGQVVSADSGALDLEDTSVTTRDVRGQLVGEYDEPLAGARVEIVGQPIATTVGDSGQFELRGVPAGAQTLFIRRIGYRPTIAQLPAVSTSAAASRRIIVRLPATSVVTLDPVVIQAQRTAAAYRQIGFDERRKTAHGFFLDATQIRRMGASQLHELAGRAPGFQFVRGTGVVDDGDGKGPHIPDGSLRVEGDKSCLYQSQTSRNHHIGDDPTCTVCVSYFADGQLIADGSGVFPSLSFRDIEAQYPPDKIAALEVYGASAAPPAVTPHAGGPSECAAVVIWTKRYLGLDR